MSPSFQSLSKPAVPSLAIALLLGIPGGLTALPSDPNKEMHLRYDSSDLDLQAGVMVYEGNVELNQGSLRIESDTLTVHRDGDVIEKVIATGPPAVLEQQPQIDQAPVLARGKRIEYHLEGQTETVAVIDEAVLEQGDVISRCDRIEFNLRESTARMMGSCVTERAAQPDDDGN